LRPSTCNLKYKIWRPCWRILKQNKRKARKSVDNLDGDVTMSYRMNLDGDVTMSYRMNLDGDVTMSYRMNLDSDVTMSYRMNTQCMFECVLCWLAVGSIS